MSLNETKQAHENKFALSANNAFFTVQHGSQNKPKAPPAGAFSFLVVQ